MPHSVILTITGRLCLFIDSAYLIPTATINNMKSITAIKPIASIICISSFIKVKHPFCFLYS